jgi:hypothetical protein
VGGEGQQLSRSAGEGEAGLREARLAEGVRNPGMGCRAGWMGAAGGPGNLNLGRELRGRSRRAGTDRSRSPEGERPRRDRRQASDRGARQGDRSGAVRVRERGVGSMGEALTISADHAPRGARRQIAATARHSMRVSRTTQRILQAGEAGFQDTPGRSGVYSGRRCLGHALGPSPATRACRRRRARGVRGGVRSRAGPGRPQRSRPAVFRTARIRRHGRIR